MNRILIILILIFNIGTQKMFSQNEWKPGYILNTQFDTIFGFIDDRDSKSKANECFFRREITGETAIYNPSEIYGYRINNGQFFISRNINDPNYLKPIFLEYLVNGKVKVYHFTCDGERYFFEKDSVLFELKNTTSIINREHSQFVRKNKEYLGILNHLMEDGNMSQTILSSNYNANSLIKIAKKYHEKVCPDEQCIIYERSLRPMRLNIGIHAGLNYKDINFGNMATAGHRLGSSLGIRFDFNNFILWKEKMSMTIDINLVRFSNYDINTFKDDFAYITYDNISYGNYIRNLEVDLKASALKIPVIFNYNFSKGKIRPYFGIGFLNMIMISQNKNFVFESYYKRFNHSIPPYSIGYTARTGSKFMTPTNNYYFVELSYENTQSLDIHNFYQFKTNSISFIAGYSF